MTLQTIATFNGTNGATPHGSLTYDPNTDLFYGTTSGGGPDGNGTIFSLKPDGTMSTIATFNGTNGSHPYGGLTYDTNTGFFYGTTSGGGPDGYGTIFSVSRDGKLSTIASFDGTTGFLPYGSLIYNSTKKLFYGTTYGGGPDGYGTIFSVSPSGTLSTIASFKNGTNGSHPNPDLTYDSSTDLFYDTTYNGGANGYGTIFSVSTDGKLSTVASFDGTNGALSNGSLTYDSKKDLFYGTTGGANNDGTIFSVSPSGTLSNLATFNGSNGAYPYGSLTYDGNTGFFYGTTSGGGANGYGAIFLFNPSSRTLSNVASFNNTNGANPQGSLTYDSKNGLFYGTTTAGGANNDGTIFSVGFTPPTAIPDTYNAQENQTLIIPATGVLTNDINPNSKALTAVLVSNSTHGTITLNSDGSFSYTPTKNYIGTDSFTYTINDGTFDSNITTDTITIADQPPVANSETFYANKNQTFTVSGNSGVLYNDTGYNSNPLTATIVSNPQHGTIALNADGSFNYTPTTDYLGIDSFTYKANDGTLDSNIATDTITITNPPPVANNDNYSTNRNQTFTVPFNVGVLANDTNYNVNPLRSTLLDKPKHGKLNFTPDGSFTYSPDTNYIGTDTFTYNDNDGTLDSNPPATVTINDDFDNSQNNTGYSGGDVHLTTFAGNHYDFQGAGEFTLAQSTVDDFKVQARQEPFKGSTTVSLNTAVAIQIAGQIFEIDSNSPTIIINGIATTLTDGVTDTVGTDQIIKTGGIYSIYSANNDRVSVTSGTYLDVQVSLAPDRQGKVHGLLGNDNGSSSNDFTLSDGTVIGNNSITTQQLYGQYGNGWRISQATSLFTYAAGQSTSTFTKLNFPSSIVTLDTLDPTAVATAKQTAQTAGITDPTLLQNATFDLASTNNNTNFLQGYVALQAQQTLNTNNPVYRFYDAATQEHFYTANSSERDLLVNNTTSGYGYEGVGFSAYLNPSTGLTPIYRFYNTKTADHFYTTSESERTQILNTLSQSYNYEGVAFYALGASSSAQSNIYRFYDPKIGQHFFTGNTADLTGLSKDWVSEGIAFKAVI